MTMHDGKLARHIKTLNEKLLIPQAADPKTSEALLDKLYALTALALNKESRADLLSAAEALKLAYGTLCLRSEEDLKWRVLISGTLEHKQYQATEYFLESGKNLLKRLTGRRSSIFLTLALAAEEGVNEGQFFLGARVFDLLVGFLPHLKNLDTAGKDGFFNCLSALGVCVLKAGDQHFFREICVVLAKQFPIDAGMDESYWDKIFVVWLAVAPQDSETVNNWLKPFRIYAPRRTGENVGWYAELMTIAGNSTCQDISARLLIVGLLHKAVRAGRLSESILVLNAAITGFKKKLALLGWKQTIYIYQPLFLFACHLNARRRVKDKYSPAYDTFLEELIKGLWPGSNLAGKLLPKWQAHFDQKARSASSKRRMDEFFRLLHSANK